MKPTQKDKPASGPTPGYAMEEQVGHLLRRAHQRHCSIFAESIAVKLTPMQFAALAMIQQCDSVSQNQLGRLVAMDPATVQGVVGRLSERGLIASKNDPDDRRRHLWRLTSTGKRLLKNIIPVATQITEDTLAPLTAKERTSFLRLLAKLA